MEGNAFMIRYQKMIFGLENKNNSSKKLMILKNTLSNAPARHLRSRSASLSAFSGTVPARPARRFFQIINFLLLSYLFLSSFFFTASLAVESPEEILRFGNSLYKEEDYYRAITEYKRFLHFYPTHPKAKAVTFQIGFSYLKGKKWDAALPIFQKLSSIPPETPLDTSLGEEAHFMTAQTYFLWGNLSSAIQEWNQFLDSYPKSALKSAATYQKSWSYFLQEKNEEAQKELSRIEDAKLKIKAAPFSQEISRWDALPYRSPFLAGLFSAILPGSGQWYDGRFWDGAAALVINGMFAYGIYATLDKHYYTPAGILIFIGSGFYGGNIFSAVSSAHKFNRNAKETQWQILKTKYSLDVEWTGSALTLRF